MSTGGRGSKSSTGCELISCTRGHGTGTRLSRGRRLPSPHSLLAILLWVQAGWATRLFTAPKALGRGRTVFLPPGHSPGSYQRTVITRCLSNRNTHHPHPGHQDIPSPQEATGCGPPHTGGSAATTALISKRIT